MSQFLCHSCYSYLAIPHTYYFHPLWSVSHVGWTEHASCCYGEYSVWGDARTLISVRLDVHRGRACVCDCSRSSVVDLYVFGRGLLATCHPPLTLSPLEGSHHHSRLVISTALPPGEWGHPLTRLNRRRENQAPHLLTTIAKSTAMKMSSTTVLSVAVLRLRRVSSVVMTLSSEG